MLWVATTLAPFKLVLLFQFYVSHHYRQHLLMHVNPRCPIKPYAFSFLSLCNRVLTPGDFHQVRGPQALRRQTHTTTPKGVAEAHKKTQEAL
jgi:hypothetical protein